MNTTEIQSKIEKEKQKEEEEEEEEDDKSEDFLSWNVQTKEERSLVGKGQGGLEACGWPVARLWVRASLPNWQQSADVSIPEL